MPKSVVAAIAALSPCAVAGCGSVSADQKAPSPENPTSSLPSNSSPTPPLPSTSPSKKTSLDSQTLINTVRHLPAKNIILLAPTQVSLKSITHTSAATGHYDVSLIAQSNLTVSFGGQNYTTHAEALNQLQQLLIITPGKGSPCSLDSGIIARAYQKQGFITWAEGNWNIEISGPPGISLSILKPPAQKIAGLLHRVVLPNTSMGVLNWAHGSNGQDSLDLSWLKGATS